MSAEVETGLQDDDRYLNKTDMQLGCMSATVKQQWGSDSTAAVQMLVYLRRFRPPAVDARSTSWRERTNAEKQGQYWKRATHSPAVMDSVSSAFLSMY